MTIAARPTGANLGRLPASRQPTRYRVQRALIVVGRLLVAFIPVFVLGTFFTFLLGAVSNLNPATIQLGEAATPQAVQALDKQWGLNRPFFVQYFDWLGHVLTGNLGNSWIKATR
ncbi:MAG: peptide/nickel transport system permease protein [Trebonia sp.]|nr:peptide/nickel transport system permease protein [Trebonia sp.]